MNDNRPLLSISIPTYNRSLFIKDTLKNLTMQLDADPSLSEFVEIVVTDSDSKDDTPNIVRSYGKKYPNIKYFTDKANVGFDLNLISAVEKASGKYCMYLGDDDSIAVGGLKFIVNYLKNNEISLLTYDLEDYSLLNTSHVNNGDITSGMIYSTRSADDFFTKGYSTGVLSMFTFDRDLWMETVDKTEILKGWFYFDVIIKMSPIATKPLVHIAYKMIYARQDCLWANNGGEFFTALTFNRLMDKFSFYGYNKNTFKKLIDNIPRNFVIYLLRAKAHDLKPAFVNYKKMYENFHQKPFYFIFLTIIFFTPNILLKTIRDLNKKIHLINIQAR